MDIFGFKARDKVETLEMMLQYNSMRLSNYDNLMNKLQKKHKYFTFTSGGGIVAYDAREDIGSPHKGTCYVVPVEMVKMEIYTA